jgi:hypothetical protein
MIFDENIKGITFITFIEDYYYTPYSYTFSFSFKELSSYLTEEFKLLINLN